MGWSATIRSESSRLKRAQRHRQGFRRTWPNQNASDARYGVAGEPSGAAYFTAIRRAVPSRVRVTESRDNAPKVARGTEVVAGSGIRHGSHRGNEPAGRLAAHAIIRSVALPRGGAHQSADPGFASCGAAL